jgi:hypothetical protein
MKAKITKAALGLSSLAIMAQPVAAQSLASEASSPETLTTGLAILLVGFLAVLTLATLVLNSPAALLGEAGSLTFFTLALVGVTSVRLFYIVGALHGLTLVATGVFKR